MNEPTEDELRDAFAEMEAQPEELKFVPPTSEDREYWRKRLGEQIVNPYMERLKKRLWLAGRVWDSPARKNLQSSEKPDTSEVEE